MNSSAESHVSESSRLCGAASSKAASLAILGADLAFLQNRRGQYASFYWKQAAAYDILDVSVTTVSQWFQPCDPQAYQQLLKAVFEEGFPERRVVAFTCQHYVVSFDLTLTPIADSSNAATEQVLVLGRLLPCAGKLEVSSSKPRSVLGSISSGGVTYLGDSSNLLSRVSFPRFLTHIARKIRQTLDFDTVWTQAADGLKDAFDISACHIFTLSSDLKTLQCVASHGEVDPELCVERLELHTQKEFAHTISHLTPTISTLADQARSRFVIATSHQGIANGLIVLDRDMGVARRYSSARSSHPSQNEPETIWYPIEIEIIEEIANQIGTAAAHATLYRELEAARIQAEELSRLKSEFLANTSHELRTPLNGMMGFLKLILDGMTDDPEEQTEFIEEAYRSAVHLLNIINDILDVAKIESGKMELDFEPVNLEELLVHLRDFTQSQIQTKHLSFEIKLPRTDDKILLYGNYQRLLQVLLNLVGNAIKFTHQGGITISCEILRRQVLVGDRVLPGMVKIQVADTGIGISLDKQDRLFKSFSQVDGSRTRTYGGTGLGLVISQKLIETMGGEVNFFSLGEGLGSTVTFTAPLYQEPVFISPAASVADLLEPNESGEDTDLSFETNPTPSIDLDLDLDLDLDVNVDDPDVSDISLESNLDHETLALAAELNLTEDGDLDFSIADIANLDQDDSDFEDFGL
jgi:signal transduction histidine kinase